MTAHHCLRNFTMRWIDHRDEAKKREVAFDRFTFQRFSPLRNVARPEREDTIGLLGESAALCEQPASVCRCHGAGQTLVMLFVTEGNNGLRRSFHKGDQPSLPPMERRHPFSVRIKGELAHARERRSVQQAMLESKLNERNLCRIPGGDKMPVGMSDSSHVMAMSQGVEKVFPLNRFDCARHSSYYEEAAVFRFNLHLVKVQAIYPHPIFRKGAGLIGADGRGASECLDGGELFDDRTTLRHALTCHCEGEGDSWQQSFRNVRSDETDPENRADPQSESHRQTDHEKERAHHKRDNTDHTA